MIPTPTRPSHRAYVFSIESPWRAVRASGDPYFSHPIEVAVS